MAYGSNYNFGGPMQSLAEMGVFDIILPFILIFTIVFAVLQKTKILGEKAKNFNMVIALVMGMSVVVPHVLWGGCYDGTCSTLSNGLPDIVNIINMALPNVSVVIVAILMVLLIFGIWGSKVKLGSNSLSGIIALVAFASVVFIFGSAAGWWHLPNFLIALENDPDTMALVITILVFAIIIWFITKSDEREEKKEDAFGKFFGSVLDNKGDHH